MGGSLAYTWICIKKIHGGFQDKKDGSLPSQKGQSLDYQKLSELSGW
jgi:hypothetical protein